jgi:hypothetical protein
VVDHVIKRTQVIEHRAHERLQLMMIELLYYFVLTHLFSAEAGAGDAQPIVD